MTAAMPIPSLLSRLTTDPSRPRLTWYADAERVELSGHVLDNWVTKTANLLVEEYDAGPGSRVVLDLPVHWRAVVWAIAAWRVGASLVLPPATGRITLVVTDRPVEHRGVDVVAVALPALARSFEGELPVGAVDATGAVMTYGDVLTWMPPPDPIGPAVEHDGGTVRHDRLLTWGTEVLTRRGGAGPGGRVLLEVGEDRAPLADMLGAVLAVYATDGSVVLRHVTSDVSAARVVETELVTDQIAF